MRVVSEGRCDGEAEPRNVQGGLKEGCEGRVA